MITYFKVVYRRHTNFAMEAIQQTFNGTATFGNKVTALISRNGDLIHSMYVQADLPDLEEVTNDTPATGGNLAGTNALTSVGPYKRYTRWVDNVGHHLLKQVEVEIGGQLIDRQYGDWLDIWAQLTVPAGKRVGYYQMIGQDPLNAIGQNSGLQADVYHAEANHNSMHSVPDSVIKGRTVYVPLQFWFCRNVGLALPLIALQYHEVKINVTFREAYELVMLNDSDLQTNAGDSWDKTKSGFASKCNLVGNLNASLWVDYIYLDTDERRRFAQVSHEYLIEQLQFTGDESITPGTYDDTTKVATTKANNIKLNFNHPVKELVWVVKAFEDRKEWSNFTDTALPAVPPFQVVGGATNSTPQSIGIIPGLPTGVIATGTLGDVASLEDVARLTNYNSVRPLGKPLDGNHVGLAGNPVDKAKLQLNGHDRFAERPGTYFNWVQCRQHHSNIPASPGINVYSFALKPEDHQPSGTCNFSRIDNATLQIKVGAFYEEGADAGVDSVIARVYAVNYNVLRIMSGMGGLAYSN